MYGNSLVTKDRDTSGLTEIIAVLFSVSGVSRCSFPSKDFLLITLLESISCQLRLKMLKMEKKLNLTVLSWKIV